MQKKYMANKNVFQREYGALKRDIAVAISKVCASGRYILGKEVEHFENIFAAYLNVKHVIAVGNGMEALWIGMTAAGIGKGDEIITTPLSAVATALAITMTGATPVFADTDEFFAINTAQIEKKITKKTKGILPVHLYGQSADINGIMRVAKRHHVQVFEDACQAHGAEYKERKLGTFGLFSAFSFYPTKNLGCYGDGGAIVTNDTALASVCRTLRNYGQKDRYVHTLKGINSRMDEIQAAILRTKLRHLDAWNIKRRAIAARYNSLLQGVGDIELPKERVDATHVYHQYVIRTRRRDELLARLGSQSISALIHYPIPIHKQPCYEEFHKLSLPNCERTCKEILSLPIHPYLKDTEIIYIAETIRKFFS